MRILIADDHALFRDGLRSLLRTQGHEVIAEARNGREAVELTKQLTPDLVLMDLSMPEMDGLTATRTLTADRPDVKVVILTASDDDASLFDAIKAGAQGYLLKNLEADDFFSMLDRASRKFHVRNILDKLRLHNRAEAVGYALRKRIADSE